MGSTPQGTSLARRALTSLVAAIGGYFGRLAALLVSPRESLLSAAAGRWNALRDAMILMGLGMVVVYTPEVVRVTLAFWDLGVREGLNELSWSLGRRLTPDLLALLVVGSLVVLPLRITGRISFDRALALGAACWIPFFLVRLFGATWRLQVGLPPSRLLEGPEWYVGLGWAGILIVVGLMVVFRDTDV